MPVLVQTATRLCRWNCCPEPPNALALLGIICLGRLVRFVRMDVRRAQRWLVQVVILLEDSGRMGRHVTASLANTWKSIILAKIVAQNLITAPSAQLLAAQVVLLRPSLQVVLAYVAPATITTPSTVISAKASSSAVQAASWAAALHATPACTSQWAQASACALPGMC